MYHVQVKKYFYCLVKIYGKKVDKKIDLQNLPVKTVNFKIEWNTNKKDKQRKYKTMREALKTFKNNNLIALK